MSYRNPAPVAPSAENLRPYVAALQLELAEAVEEACGGHGRGGRRADSLELALVDQVHGPLRQRGVVQHHAPTCTTSESS